MPEPLKVLEDGQLHFAIRNRTTGEESPHAIDVLILRLLCEECERSHNLQANSKGEFLATAAFLTDLAGRLEAQGIAGCTPTIAHQLWCASVAEIDSLKKNANETPNSPSGSTSNPEEADQAENLPSEIASAY